jgi:acetyl esterase/lipase
MTTETQARTDELFVEEDGTVLLPPIRLPLSELVSDAARERLTSYFRLVNSPERTLFSGEGTDSIAERRRRGEEYFASFLASARELYPVEIEAGAIAGVQVKAVTPRDGVPPHHQDRVVVNVHGGAFVTGAGAGALLESIPVAALGELKVVAVDYRMAPEHRFPAATDDAIAVYRELLETYRPECVAFYGASAGAVLTGQIMARIAHDGLPTPGALGILCGGAAGYSEGDLGRLGSALIGYEVARPEEMDHPQVGDAEYLADADFSDPLVAPTCSPETMAKFAPTVVVTSTRDVSMSSAVYTHTQLVKQGVDASLHVWEGHPHGFLMYPDMPESREAWEVVARFFVTRLGRQ